MKKKPTYIKIRYLAIYGANISIHWTAIAFALLLALTIGNDIIQVIACAIYIMLLVILHELGHAVFAKKLGYQPTQIILSDVHGYCVYEANESPNFYRDEALIAWGGVTAQLIVAVPLLVISSLTNLFNVKWMAPVVGVFGYLSVVMVLINLLPFKPLDGGTAWKFLRILWSENRSRRISRRIFKKNRSIRRIK